MLVLSRKPMEAIEFPSLGVSISVLSVKGQRVEVGVEAPRHIQVIRGELSNREAHHNSYQASSDELLPKDAAAAKSAIAEAYQQLLLGNVTAAKSLLRGAFEDLQAAPSTMPTKHKQMVREEREVYVGLNDKANETDDVEIIICDNSPMRVLLESTFDSLTATTPKLAV
jgi:carbon storage regulator CsrA